MGNELSTDLDEFSDFLIAQRTKIQTRVQIDRVLRLKIVREKLSQHILLADHSTDVKIAPKKHDSKPPHPIVDIMRYNVRLATLDLSKNDKMEIVLGTYGTKTPGSIGSKLNSVMAVNGEVAPQFDSNYFVRLSGDYSSKYQNNYRLNYALEMENISSILKSFEQKVRTPAITALSNNFENRLLYERKILDFVASLESSHWSDKNTLEPRDYLPYEKKLYKYVSSVENSFFKLHDAFVSQRSNLEVDTLKWAQLPIVEWPGHLRLIPSFWEWAKVNTSLKGLDEWTIDYIRLIERTRFKYLSTQKSGLSIESMFANPNKVDYIEAFIETLPNLRGISARRRNEISCFIDLVADYESLCDEANEALLNYTPEQKSHYLSRFMKKYQDLLTQTQTVMKSLNDKKKLPCGSTIMQASADSRRLLVFYMAHLGWTDASHEKTLLEQLSKAMLAYDEEISSILPDENDRALFFSSVEYSMLGAISSDIKDYISSIQDRNQMVSELFLKMESERLEFKAKRSEIQNELASAGKNSEHAYPVHFHCANKMIDHAQSHASFKFGFWRPACADQIFASELLGLSGIYLLSQEIYSRRDTNGNFHPPLLWKKIATQTLEDARDELSTYVSSLLNCDCAILTQIGSNIGHSKLFSELISTADAGLCHTEQDVRDQLSKSALTRFSNKEVEAKKLELTYVNSNPQKQGAPVHGQMVASFEDKYNRFSIVYGPEDLLYAQAYLDQIHVCETDGYGVKTSANSQFSYSKAFSSIAEHMLVNEVYETKISGMYSEVFFSDSSAAFHLYKSLDYLLAALYDGANSHKGALILYADQIYEIPAFGLLPKYPSPKGALSEVYTPSIPEDKIPGSRIENPLCKHCGNLSAPLSTVERMRMDFLEQKRIWRILQEQGPVTSRFVRSLTQNTVAQLKL